MIDLTLDNASYVLIHLRLGIHFRSKWIRFIAIRDSCNTSLWLPTTGPPKLQCSIQQTFKKAETLKSCATSCMKWLLSVQQLRLGDGQFLGWLSPVKKDMFVLDKGQLSKFKTVNISMEDIIPWKSLSLLKNGFVSGNVGMITPSSGVTSYLAFLRIFIEVLVLLSFLTCKSYFNVSS